MTRDNLEIMRAAFEALDEGGIEAMLQYIHPEFEVTTPPGLAAEPDTYRGHDGIRRWFDEFYEAMDQVRLEPHDFIAVGDRVVVPFTLRARGRTTGLVAEQEAVQVWTMRDGRAVRADVFATLDEAMAAARAASGGEGGEAPA
jgi:ketosteroid isomerase-like protein